jgi:DNA-binding beta-propeller fold protein YncE
VRRGPSALLVIGETLWVANTEAGTVSRVDSSDGESVDVGAGVPTGLASAGGLIWVLDPFANTVSVVVPDEARIVETIEVHGRAITAAGDAVFC